MDKNYWVYILANKRNGTLYTGCTSNLPKRIWEHKEGCSVFSKKYKINSLVFYEKHETIESAALREKLIKKWKRSWKLDLIEENNPHWNDLFIDLI